MSDEILGLLLPGVNGEHPGGIYPSLEGKGDFRIKVHSMQEGEDGLPQISLSVDEMEQLVAQLNQLLEIEKQEN